MQVDIEDSGKPKSSLGAHEILSIMICFVLDSHLATLWESNCPFGFLLVMFPLWSSYFLFVFLFL